jgi:hypothetical protein
LIHIHSSCLLFLASLLKSLPPASKRLSFSTPIFTLSSTLVDIWFLVLYKILFQVIGIFWGRSGNLSCEVNMDAKFDWATWFLAIHQVAILFNWTTSRWNGGTFLYTFPRMNLLLWMVYLYRVKRKGLNMLLNEPSVGGVWLGSSVASVCRQ